MAEQGRVMHRWSARFACAWRGLCYVLWCEASGRVHLVALLVVGLMGFWLKLAPWEWALIVLAAAMVVAAEALNTAIERLADRVSREREESIRLIKDVSSGGVLAAAIGAALAGTAIFGPKLWALFVG